MDLNRESFSEWSISAFPMDRVRFSSAEAIQAVVDVARQMIKDIFPHGHENSPVMGASLHIVSETYSVCLMGLSTLILLLYMISSMTSSPFAIEMGCVFSPADFSLLVPR
jgi:hypothetical protein